MTMRFLEKPYLIVSAVLLVCASAAFAKPGSLDKSFNSTGIVTSKFGSWVYADDVAIMKDGRIVVAGANDHPGKVDILVQRFLPNGTLDKTLAGSGGVITDVGNLGGVDAALAVAVQADGKILVAGITDGGIHGEMKSVVIRYNLNGSLDDSFGSGGQVISDSTTGDIAMSIIALGNGKVLVGGRDKIGGGGGFRITRYNDDGSPDGTFAGNDKTFGTPATDSFSAMALQADGKIVMVGNTVVKGDSDSVVIRLTADGELDPTFGGEGYLIAHRSSWDTATIVKIQPDGKILVGGKGVDSTTKDFLNVTRYTSTGVPDTSFAKDGMNTYALGSLQEIAEMLVQKDGKIVVVGWLTGSSLLVDSFPGDIAMIRLTVSGDLDKTFGINGQIHTDLGLYDQAHGAALQPDGKVVVVGSSNANLTLSRYHMENNVDAIVGTKSSPTTGNNIYNTTGVDQSLDLAIKRGGGKKISYVKIQNDSIFPEVFTVKGAKGNTSFSVKYLKGSKNVTSEVISGTLKTGSLAPGAGLLLKVEITARTKVARKTCNFPIVGKSVTDTSSVDTVLIKAKSN